MYYAIQHTTTFTYSAPITENVMELRKQPLDDAYQRCLRFQLALLPKTMLHTYRDYLGNQVHHFDLPAPHQKLVIGMEALVELRARSPLPDALAQEVWTQFVVDDDEFYVYLQPSHFTEPSAPIMDFIAQIGLSQRDDPLSLLRWLNTTIYDTIQYNPETTSVESLVDEVLIARAGVCQDYAHLMITLGRWLGIPCRYVSGYLFHERRDRSAVDATHAWVEAWLPSLGWVGFDPTNNVVCDDRHIRVAVGRDYGDVPPTRGVFKGDAESKLDVAVQVQQLTEMPAQYHSLALQSWGDSEGIDVVHVYQQAQQQ